MDKTIIENGFFILRFVNEDQNLVEFYESVSRNLFSFIFVIKDLDLLNSMRVITNSLNFKICQPSL